MANNQYDEIRDLHPRVNHLLNLDNWCIVNEAKVQKGQLDFAAIQRHTGRVMIVECKVGIVNTLKVIDQINRYHRAFGVPSAEKCLMTFDALRVVQLEAFADEKIQTLTVNPDTPLMPKWMSKMSHEFAYWFRHWNLEATVGGTMHDWLHSLGLFGSPLPIDQPGPFDFRMVYPRLDGTSKPYNPGPSYQVFPVDNDVYHNLDAPRRYDNA